MDAHVHQSIIHDETRWWLFLFSAGLLSRSVTSAQSTTILLPGRDRMHTTNNAGTNTRRERFTGTHYGDAQRELARGRTTRKHDMNTIHKMVYWDEIHERSTRMHDEDRVRDRFTGRHDERRAPIRTTSNALQGQQCCSVDFPGGNPAQTGSEGEQTKPLISRNPRR
jgi:uncharacterized protein YheU (UPF0270 family)